MSANQGVCQQKATVESSVRATANKLGHGLPGTIKATAICCSAWLALTLIIAISLISYNFSQGAGPATADDLTTALVISMMASMMISMLVIMLWSFCGSVKEYFTPL